MNEVNHRRWLEELLTRLAEHADWCDANEWEIPITMGNDIREAIATIKRYKAIEETTTLTVKAPCGNGIWEYAGADLKNTEDFGIIWQCKRCGFKRLAGWTPPYYNCPECTGRDQNTQKDGTIHD